MTPQEALDQHLGRKPQPQKVETPPPPVQKTETPPPAGQAKQTGGGYLDWLAGSGSKLFPPADTSRPQTWTDWGTRTYSPSAGDFGKVFGDALTDHLYGVGARAAEGEGVDTGDYGTRALEQSRRNLGPMAAPVSAAGYYLSPINKVPGLNAGLAPAANRIGQTVIPAAERYLPKFLASRAPAAISGATQNAAISASNTASRGGSPSDVALSAAEALPVGALFGGAFHGASVKPQTIDDIVGKTGADRAAAQAQLDALRFSNPGFKINGKAPSTEAELQEALKWAQSIKPGDDAGGTAPYIQRRIEQKLAEPGPQHATDALADAAQRNEQAQMLQRWHAMADVPGYDVQGAAQKSMMEQPVGSPSFDALKGIASVPKTPPAPRWLGPTQAAVNLFGSAAAEGGAAAMGAPHGGAGTAGNVVGQALSWGLGKMATPSDVSPLIQARIARAAQPMTGYAARPGGDPNALGSALMYLYQNAPPMF